jgi:hypothetical protein
MGNSQYLDLVINDPVDQLEGKAMEEITASPMLEEWPPFRNF